MHLKSISEDISGHVISRSYSGLLPGMAVYTKDKWFKATRPVYVVLQKEEKIPAVTEISFFVIATTACPCIITKRTGTKFFIDLWASFLATSVPPAYYSRQQPQRVKTVSKESTHITEVSVRILWFRNFKAFRSFTELLLHYRINNYKNSFISNLDT